LGLEVVIEDYVPLNKGRRPLIYSAKAALLIVGVASLWSLVVTAF
jgi:succinate dehydrogenase hydrophobic anchor subunit